MISIEDFAKVELRIGTITSVEDHPQADKLFVIKVDVGEDEERQLVAGIKKWYSKEDLLGKQVVVVSNLQPAKLRGIESQGMLLAAENEDESKVVLLTTDKKIENGAKVR